MELAVILMNSFDIHALVTCTFAETPLWCSLPLAECFLRAPTISSDRVLQPSQLVCSMFLSFVWKLRCFRKYSATIATLDLADSHPHPLLYSLNPDWILEHLNRYQGSSQLRECLSHLIFRTRKPNWVPAPLVTCGSSGFSSAQTYHSEV